VILGVTGIVCFAIIGRYIAQRLGQPTVLGELLIGLVLGNLGYLFGVDLLLVLREGPVIFDLLNVAMNDESVASAANAVFGAKAPELLAILQGPDGGALLLVAHVVDVFSRYGVIFLLFLVGLDNSVSQMRAVGGASLRVAVIGVLFPFGLTWLAVALVAPELPWSTDILVAATFVATSIGITAGVLEEMNAGQSTEGRVILGAAVLDDVFGLLVLAIVSGIIVSGSVDMLDMGETVLLAVVFLLGALWLGTYLLRGIVHLLRSFDVVEMKLFSAFLFVMILAWTASLVGLASIVGAFTAGLILHDEAFAKLPRAKEQSTIKELVRPFEVVLAPIFFVTMGIQVKLEDLLSADTLLLAGALTLAGGIGKIASGWGSERGSNRWMVGFGMMPRGEVALIFASIGTTLGVLGDSVFAAIVLAVAFTSLLAPPLMRIANRA
jgi:Kef-type K+ transport system membrane component KefB